MSLSTTVVACSIGVVFPCLPVVSSVVVTEGSILIVVCTPILVLSVVCVLASVWNLAIRATDRCCFQCWALVCLFHEPSVNLLVGLGCGIFKSNCVPVVLAILATGRQCRCYEGVSVSILSCVDYE